MLNFKYIKLDNNFKQKTDDDYTILNELDKYLDNRNVDKSTKIIINQKDTSYLVKILINKKETTFSIDNLIYLNWIKLFIDVLIKPNWKLVIDNNIDNKLAAFVLSNTKTSKWQYKLLFNNIEDWNITNIEILIKAWLDFIDQTNDLENWSCLLNKSEFEKVKEGESQLTIEAIANNNQDDKGLWVKYNGTNISHKNIINNDFQLKNLMQTLNVLLYAWNDKDRFNNLIDIINHDRIKITNFSLEYYKELFNNKNYETTKRIFEKIIKFLEIFTHITIEFSDQNLKIQNLVKNNNLEISAPASLFENMMYENSLMALIRLIDEKQDLQYWPSELRQVVINDKEITQLFFKFSKFTDLCVNYNNIVLYCLSGVIKFMYEKNLWNLYLELVTIITSNQNQFFQGFIKEQSTLPIIKQININGDTDTNKVVILDLKSPNLDISVELENIIIKNQLEEPLKTRINEIVEQINLAWKTT